MTQYVWRIVAIELTSIFVGNLIWWWLEKRRQRRKAEEGRELPTRSRPLGVCHRRKMTRPSLPEFVARIKLPSGAAYPSCPSGDTEYADDYGKALAAGVPPGFEPVRSRANGRWAVDSDGNTLVMLRATTQENALAMALERADLAEKELAHLRAVIAKVVGRGG